MIDDVLSAVNQRRSGRLTLLRRYTDGEQGAYLVADPNGLRFVLKWKPGTDHLDQLRFARTTTTHLRRLRYPAPGYREIGAVLGGAYWLQTVLTGKTMAHLTPALLTRLLALHELHRGRAPAKSPEVWPDEVIRTVLVGGDGYCLHDALREHSATTRDLLRTLQSLVVTHRSALPLRHDIVHFDFQSANMLVEGETISGVVDWDGARAGMPRLTWLRCCSIPMMTRPCAPRSGRVGSQ